jgi:hypothetical protein
VFGLFLRTYIVITIVRGEIVGGVRLSSRLGEKESEHAIVRCLKRLERAGEGFRGRLLDSSKNGCVNFIFQSSEEACLASIEMQRRAADIPSVAGVKLNIRIALLAAANEEKAALDVGKLLELSLPNQILCDRQTLLEVAANVGLKARDLHQELSLGDDETPTQVMELLWHESEEEDMPATLTSTMLLEQESTTSEVGIPVSIPGGQVRLRVRYGDKDIVLDEKTPFITLGREHHNDIVVDDLRASRQHARIERRGGRYCLVDMSTNGTFVTHVGDPEVFLRKDSLPLRGTGILCFGASARDPDAKKLKFEFL